MSNSQETAGRWYEGVTRYQWLVLIIASLGWVFDVFEGQIFVASMNEAMPALVPERVRGLAQKEQAKYVAFYNNVALGAFLLGGALGGVLFGMLSDRIGRVKTMVYTIVMYSVFTSFSAVSQTWWHMAVFRFLVAMGVGGEWAVASALVAEVFPQPARARSLAIFHASSVFGTLLAIAAGWFVVAEPTVRLSLGFTNEPWELAGWRAGFLLGVVPALLIIWIRLSLHEPEHRARHTPSEAAGETKPAGNVAALFQSGLARRTLVGVGLAAVGLATFWGTHIYGKDTLRKNAEAPYRAALPPDASEDEVKEQLKPYAKLFKRWEMIGMILVTVGGGRGLVAFGPLCEWIGRRGAFLAFHLGGLVAAVILFQFVSGKLWLMLFLPIFGCLTLGMHAGYAVYFPQLFPTRLRGTGSGFCFNMGRVLAAPVLVISGLMQRDWKISLESAATILSFLFLVGVVLLHFAPETKGQDLPE